MLGSAAIVRLHITNRGKFNISAAHKIYEIHAQTQEEDRHRLGFPIKNRLAFTKYGKGSAIKDKYSGMQTVYGTILMTS
jgi:hypothetical protein